MTPQDELWIRYGASKDPSLREELILRYAPLVKHVVGRMAIHVPSILESDDIVSYGILGLIRAVDHYDPFRGVGFEAYAVKHIRGSVLDALRDLNPLSRGMTEKIRRVENAIAALEQEHQRPPSDDEVADHLGITQEELHGTMKYSGYYFVSLDSPIRIGDEGESMHLEDVIPDQNSIDPLQATIDEEARQALLGAIAGLPDRDRLVLSLYYRDELTLREIGEVLGVSLSRVNQLHTRAILRLRAALRAIGKPDDLAQEALLQKLRA